MIGIDSASLSRSEGNSGISIYDWPMNDNTLDLSSDRILNVHYICDLPERVRYSTYQIVRLSKNTRLKAAHNIHITTMDFIVKSRSTCLCTYPSKLTGSNPNRAESRPAITARVPGETICPIVTLRGISHAKFCRSRISPSGCVVLADLYTTVRRGIRGLRKL